MSNGAGSAVVYVGSATAAVSGQAAQAKPAIPPETINLLSVPVPIPHVEVTIGDVLTIIALCVTIARFRWDVKRERKKNDRRSDHR